MEKPDWWPKNPFDGKHKGERNSMMRSIAWGRGSNACWRAFCDWLSTARATEIIQLQWSVRDEQNPGQEDGSRCQR